MSYSWARRRCWCIPLHASTARPPRPVIDTHTNSQLVPVYVHPLTGHVHVSFSSHLLDPKYQSTLRHPRHPQQGLHHCHKYKLGDIASIGFDHVETHTKRQREPTTVPRFILWATTTPDHTLAWWCQSAGRMMMMLSQNTRTNGYQNVQTITSYTVLTQHINQTLIPLFSFLGSTP